MANQTRYLKNTRYGDGLEIARSSNTAFGRNRTVSRNMERPIRGFSFLLLSFILQSGLMDVSQSAPFADQVFHPLAFSYPRQVCFRREFHVFEHSESIESTGGLQEAIHVFIRIAIAELNRKIRRYLSACERSGAEILLTFAYD